MEGKCGWRKSFLEDTGGKRRKQITQSRKPNITRQNQHGHAKCTFISSWPGLYYIHLTLTNSLVTFDSNFFYCFFSFILHFSVIVIRYRLLVILTWIHSRSSIYTPLPHKKRFSPASSAIPHIQYVLQYVIHYSLHISLLQIFSLTLTLWALRWHVMLIQFVMKKYFLSKIPSCQMFGAVALCRWAQSLRHCPGFPREVNLSASWRRPVLGRSWIEMPAFYNRSDRRA